MTKEKEWAECLNGREYCNEMTGNEERQAEQDGVVIVFGASDDSMKFRGAIYGEVGAWNGREVKLTNNPDIYTEDANHKTFEFNRDQIKNMPVVTAIWCLKDKDGQVWTSCEIQTAIPHETFDIMEDGELFCRGLVFDAKHLTEAKL